MHFGYTIIYVPDVAASLAFFTRAFGLARRFLHESGTYGELETGATTLAFAAHALGETHFPGGHVAAHSAAQPLGFPLCSARHSKHIGPRERHGLAPQSDAAAAEPRGVGPCRVPASGGGRCRSGSGDQALQLEASTWHAPHRAQGCWSGLSTGKPSALAAASNASSAVTNRGGGIPRWCSRRCTARAQASCTAS
jgi:lactoylglutathione lyase